ncbi:endonuclease/exonuclease/phosphatase family protein [Kineosporia sp. NBRC 101677]|uniref:endonuclease/exonuclease/phosphatase family protein n=1 Tax=Kineosporia sp. NBRC 101677 TaxID=3032197 RepID=UPI00255436D1|nr:endonuclease/exonuclease/phosphatase family protein [Kineosporia sp. NBRC 101677]
MTAGILSGRPLLATTAMLAVVLYGALATLHVIIRQVAGDQWSWLYVANMLGVIWWAPAVLVLPLAFLGRAWWPAALLSVLPAVVWVSTFGPYLVPGRADPSGVSAGATQVRAIAWNVRPRNPSADLAALIAEADPDIMLLAEVPSEYLDDVAAAAPGLPHHYFAPIAEQAPCCGHTAVLSRYPIVASRVIEGMPAEARTASVVTVDVDGTRLDLVPLHLASPLSGRGLPDLGHNSRLRMAETEIIADALRTTGNPLLVGGDLNSAPANTPRKLLLGAGLQDLQAEAGSGFGTTRRKIRVDWVYGRDLTAQRAWTGNARNSDHRPVLVDFTLPG